MSKDNKKANPLLEDEVETTESPVEVKAAKAVKPTKAKAVEADEEVGERPQAEPLITREKARDRSQNNLEREVSADIKLIKESLAKEPKVRISIPLGIGEKRGSPSAVESVTINGYRMVMPKGEYLTVPQSVADIIERHYNMSPENTTAGEAFRLDKNRTKDDGMTTDEALLN